VQEDDRSDSWAPSPRGLVLGVLCCGLVARSVDANPHPSWHYVPFVVAAYVLPLWYSTGMAREVWSRYRIPLVATQAALTYVPFAVFGHAWVGGVSGLLGGLVLLLLPQRIAWPVFLVLVVLEPVLWWWVGSPYEPAGNALFWVVNAFVVSAVTCYALNRLVDLLEALAMARRRLVGNAVAEQRLSAATHLKERIVERLAVLSRRAGAAVAPGADVDRVREELVATGRLAREAALDARQLLVELPEPVPVEPPQGAAIAPRLARVVTTVVVVLFAVQAVLNVLVRPEAARVGSVTAVAAVLVGTATVLLLLRDLLAGPDGKPSPGWSWRWVLSGVLVLALTFAPSVGSSALGLLALVAASALAVVRHRWRWLVLVVLAVIVPVLTLSQPAFDLLSRRDEVRWATYATAAMVGACLLVYGLGRLTRASVALEQTHQEAVDSAALREQLRLAQDAHDTLGLGLSTIALKSDLSLSLLDTDPERSRREAVQLMHLADVVSRDAEAVAEGRTVLDLERELVSARTTLAAAGTHAAVSVEGPVLGDVQDVLATVLREAITNVIRHSRATVCTVTLRRDAAGLVLHVSNDRALPTRESPGLGLRSMSERLHAVGGRLVTDRTGDRFDVVATVPLDQHVLAAR